ncbi:MAG: SDR family oxidoreductase [Oscillochloris sp.]|nr:SDR family oxidoreductase [Oscillochloris sp.]
MDLHNHVAIVTGGTGGLGQAVIAALLSAGARVIVPYRRIADLEQVRTQTGAGDSLSGMELDLTDPDAVAQAYSAAIERHGGLDILVNIAGGFAGGAPVHETDWALWQQQFDLNLKTAVLSSMAATPHLIARGGGAIVNTATRTALQAGSHLAAYAASKRALLQLTEAMAEELKPHHVSVNSILPSVIDTAANRSAMPKADYRKWVTPEAIARVVLFLVGPDARIISGAHIPVYGDA